MNFKNLTIIDREGSRMEIFINSNNKIVITITEQDVEPITVFALEDADAFAMKKELEFLLREKTED
ncbi:MAG: hypothetical protein LBC84_00805 [Prevotellaceae bacterium]|jgi:CMP-N-acetylneuraminic acid synthetase|nr:hypothetical protein [Prevotellaceae bacterium]